MTLPTKPRSQGKPLSGHPDKNDALSVNRLFYNALWEKSRLIDPSRFNTWPLIKPLAEAAPLRLEVGPGMRPRLSIPGTHFVDISKPALGYLAAAGGLVKLASIAALPYPDNTFDLVCALDIIEHVEDDVGAWDELCRVAKPSATLLLSTPLHADGWNQFDELVGHCRRYEPDQFRQLLADHHLDVKRSAAYGMKPKSSKLVDWGMRQLQKHPKRAMWLYNRLIMPFALRFQNKLFPQDGMLDTALVTEVFVVCRFYRSKQAPATPC